MEETIQQVYHVDKQCEQVFKAKAAELELQRKRARQQRRSEIGANHDANQTQAKLEPQKGGRKRRRIEPEARMPRIDMDYVQKLRKIIAPLFKAEHSGETDNEPNHSQLIEWSWGSQLVHLERALIHLLFAHEEYKQVIEAINQMRLDLLPRQLYGEIQELWDRSNYHTVQLKRPVSEFTPVITFRIRQKHPCPTWRWTGKPKYNIPERAHLIMDEHFRKFSHKPSRHEKHELAAETGLNYSTVTNWFKNRRQRCNTSRRSLDKSFHSHSNDFKPMLQSQGSETDDQLHQQSGPTNYPFDSQGSTVSSSNASEFCETPESMERPTFPWFCEGEYYDNSPLVAPYGFDYISPHAADQEASYLQPSQQQEQQLPTVQNHHHKELEFRGPLQIVSDQPLSAARPFEQQPYGFNTLACPFSCCG